MFGGLHQAAGTLTPWKQALQAFSNVIDRALHTTRPLFSWRSPSPPAPPSVQASPEAP